MESWLAAEYGEGGLPQPELTARQVTLLLEGAFSAMLIHRDSEYVTQAGKAAAMLVQYASVLTSATNNR